MARTELGGVCSVSDHSCGTFGAVITINGNDYRLVLLDTNALSEFAKQGDSFRHFLAWSSAEPMFVPCFSLFSVLEMRRRPDVYGRFKELFRVLPEGRQSTSGHPRSRKSWKAADSAIAGVDSQAR